MEKQAVHPFILMGATAARINARRIGLGIGRASLKLLKHEKQRFTKFMKNPVDTIKGDYAVAKDPTKSKLRKGFQMALAPSTLGAFELSQGNPGKAVGWAALPSVMTGKEIYDFVKPKKRPTKYF